jgi:hypothetical protein
MTNRREFLQAVAVAGFPGITAAAGCADAVRMRSAPDLDLHAALLDGRHAEARSFGKCLASAATPVCALPDGDITQIWLREIGPVWRDQPVAVAGLTARPALFCLEQLAWSCGLRVVFHGEHVMYPYGETEHSLLRGGQEARLSVRELVRAGSRWPARIARAIAIHRQDARPQRFGPSDAALERAAPEGARLLASWIIAPV